jgi:acetolactate synthase small subunit
MNIYKRILLRLGLLNSKKIVSTVMGAFNDLDYLTDSLDTQATKKEKKIKDIDKSVDSLKQSIDDLVNHVKVKAMKKLHDIQAESAKMKNFSRNWKKLMEEE